MLDFELGAVQERFADLVWENEPIASGERVRLCEQKLCWKKPTTYTVLRKLCEKGLFVNDGGTVRTLVTQEEFRAARGERFVAEAYGGSLPAFIAAFTARRSLSAEEAAEIQKLIDAARRED